MQENLKTHLSEYAIVIIISLSLQFNRLTLKSPSKKTDFSFFRDML